MNHLIPLSDNVMTLIKLKPFSLVAVFLFNLCPLAVQALPGDWQVEFARLSNSEQPPKTAACVLLTPPQAETHIFCRYQLELQAPRRFFRDDSEGGVLNSRGQLNTANSMDEFLQKLEPWLQAHAPRSEQGVDLAALKAGFNALEKVTKSENNLLVLAMHSPATPFLNYESFALSVHSLLRYHLRQRAQLRRLETDNHRLHRLQAELQQQLETQQSAYRRQRQALNQSRAQLDALQQSPPVKENAAETAPAVTPKSVSPQQPPPAAQPTNSNGNGLLLGLLAAALLLIGGTWFFLQQTLRRQHDKLARQMTGEFAAVQEEMEKIKLNQGKMRALQEEQTQSTTLEANAAWVLLEEIKDKFVAQTHDKVIINTEKNLSFVKRLKEDVEDSHSQLAKLTGLGGTASFQEHIEHCATALQNTAPAANKPRPRNSRGRKR